MSDWRETREEDGRWQQAALRVGEELASVGPTGYYTFTATAWRDWALQQLRSRKTQRGTSMADPMVKLIVETMAIHLASFPRETLTDTGCSPTLTAGIRAACEAFYQHVTEAEIEILQRDLFADVRHGLAELDAKRRGL